MSRKKPIGLYWVSTEDTAEDWFVLATSNDGAARFHEHSLGLDRYEAFATLVIADVQLADYGGEPPPCNVDVEDLKKLGIELIEPRPDQRALCLGGWSLSKGGFKASVFFCSIEIADAFERRQALEIPEVRRG
jgi:hypothetical protein